MLDICVDIHALGALYIHKEFLGMATDLRARSCFDVLLDLFPIFSVNVESYIYKKKRVNFICPIFDLTVKKICLKNKCGMR